VSGALAARRGAVTEHETPCHLILAKHGISWEDIRIETEHTRYEHTLRRSGQPVPADLVRLVAALQGKVAAARHELYYLLPGNLKELQHRSWMDPDTTDDFNRLYLDWLESEQP
jgi:hypothetical protein